MRFAIYVDSAPFRYGEPLAWRLELQNLTVDSLGFYPYSIWNDVQFYLTGPGGSVPRIQVYFDFISNRLDWMMPRETRAVLHFPYPVFVIDPSARANVFPLLPPGTYRLRAELRTTAVEGGSTRPVRLAAEASFRVLSPDSAYRDTIETAASRFISLTSDLAGGTATPRGVLVALDSTGVATADAAWMGVLLYEMRAQVFSRASSPALDSLMQTSLTRYTLARRRFAFANWLLASLSPERRAIVCHELLGKPSPNELLACGSLGLAPN